MTFSPMPGEGNEPQPTWCPLCRHPLDYDGTSALCLFCGYGTAEGPDEAQPQPERPVDRFFRKAVEALNAAKGSKSEPQKPPKCSRCGAERPVADVVPDDAPVEVRLCVPCWRFWMRCQREFDEAVWRALQQPNHYDQWEM